MGRTSSNSADFFMHRARPGKTLFILERRWGNDGYAFWFKLLELLTASEGHFFSLREPPEREYFRARMNLSGPNPDISASEILTVLSDLGKIDHDLWKVHNIIWCQNLVNGLADTLYKKRNHPPPQKPSMNGNISVEKTTPQKDNLPENGKTEAGKVISDADIHIGREVVREGGSESPAPLSATPSPQEKAGEPSSTKVHTLDSVIERMRASEPGLMVGLSQREQLEAVRIGVGDDTLVAVWEWSRKARPKPINFFLADWSSVRAAWEKARPQSNGKRNGVFKPEPPLPRTAEDDAAVELLAAKFRQDHHQRLSDRDRELLGAAAPVGEFPEGAA